MRRADRLFQIIQYLRSGRLTTAADLAKKLEVSTRTIYRDIADLQASGVPIDGEAGIGYILGGGFELPPLMFSTEEVVALVAGARLIRAWGGVKMAQSALAALDKIESVLPEESQAQVQQVEIHARSNEITDAVRVSIDKLEESSANRKCLRIQYSDSKQENTQRVVQPLGLWFWGKVWTLVAWCRLREDFRMFRVDRIKNIEDTGEEFTDEKLKSLKEFYRQMEAKQECEM